MRSGRQKQPMLEARRDISNRAGDAGVNRVTSAAGRRGVMSLVENQQRAGTEIVEPCAERSSVRFVDEQILRNKKARERRPGVDGETVLLPHLVDVVAIENLEGEAESSLHLVLPLRQHRRRTSDDDFAYAAA